MRGGGSAGVRSMTGWRRVDGEQCLAELVAGLWPVRRIAGERGVDEVDEPDRDGRPEVSEVGGVALQSCERGVGVGFAEERHPTGEAFVEHEAERVDVGATVEAFAADLFGRQVLGGAHHHVVAGEVFVAGVEPFRDPEVGEQDAPVGGDEDVAGFDVAVHEAAAVRLVECARDRGADVDREFGAESLLRVEQLAEALAVDELHHDGLASVVDDDVVDGDDVGVAQSGDRDRLAPEPLGDDGVGGEVGLEPFDRDLAIEVDVGGHPHLGHAALPDSAFELIPLREQLTRGQLRRGWGGCGHDPPSR